LFVVCVTRDENILYEAERENRTRMQEFRPSRTALRVAIRRATHQLVDRPLVFEDPLAIRILDHETAKALQTNTADFDGRSSRALRAFFVARARYAEDQIAKAIEKGVRQVVVLGAGLDTFAYRHSQACGLRCFEVDHPATQAWSVSGCRMQGSTFPIRSRLLRSILSIRPSKAD
jgi:methyltransferase (TIGR00027 family)